MEFSRNDIAAFLAAERTGSVSRAAIALGLTQPSVSKAIRRLEEVVGVRLVERGVHGITLTSEGRLFLETAKSYEAQHFELVRLASELRAHHAGLLRVGVTSPSMDSLAVQAISTLVRRRPGLRIQLRIGQSDELNQAVQDGLLDLAVVPSYPGQSWGCTQVVLGTEDVQIVVRHNHPLTRLAQPGLEDLTAYAWVMPSPQSAARQMLHHVLQSHGAPAPQVAIEVEYLSEAALGIVAKTDLLTLVPGSVLRHWLSHVRPLPMPVVQFKRLQVLLTRPHARTSALIQDLQALLLEPLGFQSS